MIRNPQKFNTKFEYWLNYILTSVVLFTLIYISAKSGFILAAAVIGAVSGVWVMYNILAE